MATDPFSVSDSREGVARDRVETTKTRVERPMLETNEAEEGLALQTWPVQDITSFCNDHQQK